MRRNSSVDVAALRRMSRVGQVMRKENPAAIGITPEAPGGEFHEKV